jgi:hypothetical protein
MRIIGVLIFYEENPTWLSAAVASAGRFVDHLVAVDGAYALFPDARPRSGPEQHEAITAVASATGLGLTLHVPATVWYGNEVEKRSFSLSLAEQVADLGDWYFLFDADEIVTNVPADLRRRLEQTDLEVAEATLWEACDPNHPAEQFIPGASLSTNRVRKFYKAIPGLRVHGAHFVYAYPGENGRLVFLWPPPDVAGEPALDLHDVEVQHRQRFRDRYRARLALDYYQLRDATRAEQTVDILMEGVDGEPALLSAARV